ncbi:hypothetical protein FN846DRAFT_892856 [Sphaerosporella brunnea]|uniref:Uncharacterized protein n=1 Tax=Sphaerosporella brunnea TaxID=1250544 RepID=A0A5J5ENR7_9PEZI|nr:hypothetical protein FN846DRAFT_892856 [Sphaerosporella brunnea]
MSAANDPTHDTAADINNIGRESCDPLEHLKERLNAVPQAAVPTAQLLVNAHSATTDTNMMQLDDSDGTAMENTQRFLSEFDRRVEQLPTMAETSEHADVGANIGTGNCDPVLIELQCSGEVLNTVAHAAVPTADHPMRELHVKGDRTITDSDMGEVDVNIDDIKNLRCECNRHGNEQNNTSGQTVGTEQRSQSAAATTSRVITAHLMREMDRLDDEFCAAYLEASNIPIVDEQTIPADATRSGVVLELCAINAALREQLKCQHKAIDKLGEIYLAFGELVNELVTAFARDIATRQ